MHKLILIVVVILGVVVVASPVVTAVSPQDSLVLVAFQGHLYKPVDAVKMEATAYTAGAESTGKSRTHPAYGITYSGAPVKEDHTIAVDPKVIPLGSWVYIEDMGIYRAEDTGGLIKGNRIDIYMSDVKTALQFGVKTVNVHILPVEPGVSN